MLLLFATFLALAVFELGVRAFFPLHTIQERHPVFSSVYVPGLKTVWRGERPFSSEFGTPVSFNSVSDGERLTGWHDVARDYEKKPPAQRVIFLGDSFTAALQVRLEDTFFRRFERQCADLNVEAVSFGHNGYGTAQEALVLEKLGLKFDPDLVVIMFFVGNDFQNNSRELEGKLDRPYPRIENGTLVIDGFERPRDEARPVRNFLQGNFHSYRLLKLLLFSAFGTADETQRQVGFFEVYNVARRPASFENAFLLTVLTLERIRDVAGSAGAETLVVLVPQQEAVYPDRYEKLKRSFPPGFDFSHYDFEKPEKDLAVMLDKKGIRTLRLLPAFKQSSENLYFERDGHFTEKGHALTARLIEKYVRANRLLERN